MEERVYDHLALVIGPVLRDMRRRQRAILGWQVATVVLLVALLIAVVAILLLIEAR